MTDRSHAKAAYVAAYDRSEEARAARAEAVVVLFAASLAARDACDIDSFSALDAAFNTADAAFDEADAAFDEADALVEEAGLALDTLDTFDALAADEAEANAAARALDA